jgi:Na+-transporting NADH:ubiquinone oxidoreductase subunit NqrB
MLAGLASTIAVASKFVVRVRGKHVFNPTNGALALLLVLRAPVWVSAGQWGTAALFCFAIACAGMPVVHRAARSDVTFGFLGVYALLLFGRALWLGQRFAVPLHQLSSGALLLFAFFMISDPRTTPDSRAGRFCFAALVALGGAFVPFVLYRTNGLLWSLAVCSLLVPLIDRLLPAARYQWTPSTPKKGHAHETLPAAPRLRPAAVALTAPGA